MIGSFLAKSIPHSLCRYQGCSLNKESFCDFMYIMAAFVNHIEDCLSPQNRVCCACTHCRVALCRCHQDQSINVDGLILMTPTKRNSAMGTSTAYPILRRKTILDMIHKRCHNIHEIAKGFF